MATAHDTSKKHTDFASWKLAEWAAGLSYDDLSDEAIHAAKLYLFDSFGCALGGSQQHDVQIMLDYARALGGNPACTVFGTSGGNSGGNSGGGGTSGGGLRTDPVMAALLNALCIRAMDYNDIYWKQDPSHPSDIIPAALSMIENRSRTREEAVSGSGAVDGKPLPHGRGSDGRGSDGGGSDGRDLILATVIGHEIEMRLCEFAFPGVREYGWHHATLTCLASPIVAGRMLGLSPAQIQQAVGIAASHSMTLGAVTAGKLTNMKNTVDPMSTRAGVEAAMLAQRGYSGPEHIIDGKEGLIHCFEKFGGSFDLDILLGNLPSTAKDHYKILDCGMKSFPIEALSHAPLTAMMKIVKENDVNPDDVAEIKVEVIARAADILGDPAKYRPTSKETADHSLPYSLAVGLVDGMVTPLQFKQERIDDPNLPAVMDKIKVVPNEEFESLFPKYQPSQVTITLKDGKSFQARVDVPKGDPRDPMTEEEIAVKFNALGRDVVGEAKCNDLRTLIMGIENEQTLERLFELMTQ